VEDGESVYGEDVLGGADAREASADVVGGVVGEEASEGEPVMDAGVEGTISSEPEPVLEVRQSDEYEREEGLLIPLVVEKDVQVVERVLMKEVGLVDEEDGADALFGEVLDVGANGEEEISRGGGLREAEGEAEMAIEVSASDGRILAVDESEVGGARAWRRARRTQVFPTPGSPVSSALARACMASVRSSTRESLDGGNQSSASAMSFANGSAASPKWER
jgi:hypothetical protein